MIKRHPTAVLLLWTVLWLPRISRADDRPIDGIEDNSFLIEEAYNQESGVVQHIFNAYYSAESNNRGWTFVFTQEWPIFSQDHQFSFTIPSYHRRDQGEKESGVGDVLLNYRYQALYEEKHGVAFAPRLSLIVPTGNRHGGTGNGVVGVQSALPFSKKITDRVAMHANLGITYYPRVRLGLDAPGSPLSQRTSFLNYYVGASAIYAIAPRFNLMLEWLGLSQQSLDGDGNRSRAFSAILSPGVRAAVIDKKDFQSVIGFAVPIGVNRKADNFGAFLYLSLEHKLF